MNKIYVLNGYPRSGKTLFGELVGNSLKENGISFIHTSSIDPVKTILKPKKLWDNSLTSNDIVKTVIEKKKKEVVGDIDWDGVTKDEFWRKAMSDLKLKLNEWNPYLIHGLVLDKIKNSVKEPFVAFVDIREPENIAAFQEYVRRNIVSVGSIETIFVKSDQAERANNYSDNSIENMKYDIVIENNRLGFDNDSIALASLTEKANIFVEQEVLGRRRTERIY